MSVPYDKCFYARQSAGSECSAREILRVLFALYRPASMVDFGCGIGTWLKIGHKLGVRTLEGYEGAWVNKEQLLLPDIRLFDANVAEPIQTERFDLALCIEVAEHIPAEGDKTLIGNLCRASDVVLFSAAVPHQGGVGHVNEQWQSYWVRLFEAEGYDVFDVIRPVIWNNATVRYWHRQNILLFVRRGSSKIDQARLREAEKPILDLIHPEMHEAAARDAKTSLRRFAWKARGRLRSALGRP
jgi:Methyltransferase domain